MKTTSLTFVCTGLLLFSTGCSKDDTSSPSPSPVTKGSLKATASPANAATRINIIKGTDTVKATPDANGLFNVQNLEAGTYNIVFSPTTSYNAPAAQNAQITASQTTDLGIITFNAKTAASSFTAVVNGTNWAADIRNAGKTTSTIGVGGTTYTLTGINITAPLALGTHSSTTDPNVTGSYTEGTGAASKQWSSMAAGGSASITITKLDLTGKKISGTFTFTAPAQNVSATGTKTATNGIFNEITIQ